MGKNRSVVADDHHGGENTGFGQCCPNGRAGLNVHNGLDVSTVKVNLHAFGSQHHAYERRAKATEQSRGRIARYCGGFEIHCPLDAGVQIPLSALFTQAKGSDVYDPQQAHVNGGNESKGVMQNPRALSITTHLSSY